jgi:opacity protein-like surface antigen
MMKSVHTLTPRLALVTILTLGGLLASAAPGSAQGLGIGGRFSWVKSDVNVDVDSLRFAGGQLRLLGQHAGIELSLDRHSESSELLKQKVTETPLQASFLLRMGGGRAAPYLLGGPGWYRRTITALDAPTDLSVTTTEFGWHAGVGLEIIPNRHLGIHGDYRYTFLDFNGDGEDEGFISRLLPGHRGSMWTLGATFYF